MALFLGRLEAAAFQDLTSAWGNHFKKGMEGEGRTIAIIHHGFSRKLGKTHL